MHGFKSFAKRTELVFNNDFNCVVGPNGSGKSNILDALCFVLGKTSAKAMRTEKSSHLIYNGGKSKKPAEKAEVSIFFDNTKKEFPYDFDEIKVSRFVNHKGNSIYKINDKTVTRQQVIELLSLAKIDADGHNIILQGDIVKFVEMGGEERRMLIEEIAGISVYEDKKNKAISNLQQVEEKLKEADIVLKERGDYLKELKKERDEALKYSDLNTKLKTSKASYLYKQIERKSSEAKKYDDKVSGLKEAIEKHANSIAELKNSINQKRTEIDEINKEIETKGEKEQVSLHKEVEELRVSIGTSKNKIESLKNEISKIKQRKEQLQENIKEVREKIQGIESEQKATEREISSKNKELDLINKKIEDFRKKNKLDDIADIEKRMDELDKSVDQKQKEVEDLRLKQQDLLREKDKAEFHVKAIDEKMEKMLEIEKENKAQVEELKQKKEEFKKTTSELNQILNKNSNISAQLATARGKLNTANEELSKIQAKLSALREVDGAVAEILEQKNKIKGIYGTVAELGKVSSKYALALDVAAANRIRSIVVDTDQTAQKCIDFLKQKKLGIGNFIPLNKIRSKSADESARKYAKHEGVLGFAVDLVSFDKKYEAAFNYVFGSTLVVENLDVARKIGIGNIKMVSLDGDVAEASGLMQGGYREKKGRAGFTQAELDDDMKKHQAAVSDNEQLISRLEKERSETENRIAKLREFKANLEVDIIKLEKFLHLETDDTDASKKIKKEKESELLKLDKEIDKINQRISDINSEMADLRMEKQDLRDKVGQIRNPILLAELNAFEQKRTQLKEEVIKIEALAKNFETQIKTMLSPETEKTLSIVRQHDKEELEFTEEIEKLKELISNNTKLLKEKESLEEKFMKQFKGLFVKRQNIDEDISEMNRKIEDVGEKLRKEELDMNSVNIENVRVSTELEGLKKEYELYQGVELDTQTSENELKSMISKFENMLAKMDSVNMKALEMYDVMEKEFGSLNEKKGSLAKEREDVLLLINEIETRKKELFMKSFEAVNEQFKQSFSQLLTKGSEAFLKLENPEDPFAAGVEIRVKLAGNKFMDIRSLSGGEKTMTALAFIFAIQEFEPASFYILDEVDAALDKANAERLAKLVNQYSDRAQYIMISHNDGVIGSAKTLYGVSMDEHGMSNVVSLKL
jgi:chromosome segregation protein